MLRKLQQIDEIAIKAIRCNIRRAIGRGWFQRYEFDDLLQDVAVHLLEKIDCYDPTRSKWSTFCTLVTRNYLASEAKRRRRLKHVDSIHQTMEGDDCRLDEAIENRHTPGRFFCETRTEYELLEIREYVHHLVERLPDELGGTCESFLNRPTFNETAHHLGVTRHTIYRRRHVVEKLEDGQYNVVPLRNPAATSSKFELRGGTWRKLAQNPKRVQLI